MDAGGGEEGERKRGTRWKEMGTGGSAEGKICLFRSVLGGNGFFRRKLFLAAENSWNEIKISSQKRTSKEDRNKKTFSWAIKIGPV